MSVSNTTRQADSLRIITERLSEAAAARKCHGCGCLHKTVEALSATNAGKDELASVLSEARAVFKPTQYDCLGCPVCYPAIAANAFSEVFPDEGAGLDLCPTEATEERKGWPPLAGDYHVIRYNAPVAVCTLNSERLASHLREDHPEGLAIVGTLHTENLGIERIIRNTLANPNIRFLVLCGEDTKQSIGHLPGQSLECLIESGTDDHRRIRGARGRRPVIKNITGEQVQAFREQVELVALIGEEDPTTICATVRECSMQDPGPYYRASLANDITGETIEAEEPPRLTLDPAGYFVVFPDRRRRRLVVEHYTDAGVLDCVVEGCTPGAVYSSVIDRQLISRLDHAAYLGRELARAERALETEGPYVQDRAPGEKETAPAASSCGCPGPCGEEK